jgi:pimeloyl-ACP methyl ester carboxylesterase
MSALSSTSASQAVAKRVYRAFSTPGKYGMKAAEREVLEWGNNYRIRFDGGELAVTTWGSSDRPAVLLVHGWGGARAQMTGFVDPLLFAGYRVVTYDQPAHGDSDGKMTNFFEIAPTMDLIAQQEGSFHAVIAHSFGTLITSYALVKRGFPLPTRLVYFGAFNRLMDSLPRFQILAGLSDEAMEGFRLLLYENFGRDVLEAITNEAFAPQINIPALMFHAVTDNVTPIEDSRAIARVWRYAHLFELEGTGHRGSLQSKSIHEQVVRFLKHEM